MMIKKHITISLNGDQEASDDLVEDLQKYFGEEWKVKSGCVSSRKEIAINSIIPALSLLNFDQLRTVFSLVTEIITEDAIAEANTNKEVDDARNSSNNISMDSDGLHGMENSGERKKD